METQQDNEVEEAEAAAEVEVAAGVKNKPHLVEVIVDRQPQRVEAGDYVVAAFKALVGVAADRELDTLRHGIFEPLADEATITVVGGEKFVSHARTGGSS